MNFSEQWEWKEISKTKTIQVLWITPRFLNDIVKHDFKFYNNSLRVTSGFPKYLLNMISSFTSRMFY